MVPPRGVPSSGGLAPASRALGDVKIDADNGGHQESTEQMARFDGHYFEWSARRIEAIIDWYGGDWFRDKRVLEVGAGYGDIGLAFWQLGADVTWTEGRKEHVDVLRQRLSMVPAERIMLLDAEGGLKLPEGTPRFDLVVHLGLLYHLDEWRPSLIDAAEMAPFMVLETEVCDSSDPSVEVKVEEHDGYDQALHGTGSRPSAEMIEGVMAGAGLHYQRLADDRCNASIHVYDWPVTNSKQWKDGQRRWWWCGRESIRPTR